MLNALSTIAATVAPTWNLRGQTAQPPIGIELAESNLWFYRPRTTKLLRRYGRLSVEVGRLPSLLGKGHLSVTDLSPLSQELRGRGDFRGRHGACSGSAK